MGHPLGARVLAVIVTTLLLSGCFGSYGPAPLDPAAGDAAIVDEGVVIGDFGLVDDAGIDADEALFDAAEPLDAGSPSVGAGTSFTIEAELSYVSVTSARRPSVLTGTLWLAERADGSLDAVIGTAGLAGRALLTRDADGTWPVTWRWRPREPLGSCSPVENARLDARLTLHDDDGDGLADRISGIGAGRLQHRVTDFTEDFLDYTAIVTGRAEHEPPTLRWVSYVAGFLPLTRSQMPTLVASEPLVQAGPGVAWLEGSDGERVDLDIASFDDPSLFTSWYAWSATPSLLPSAGVLTPHFDGELRDLTGLALVAPPTLRTLPMPAPVVREGLEPGSTAYLEDHAMIVSGIGSIGAISGTQSALIESRYPGDGGARLVTRIVVPAGATQLRFRARYLAPFVAPTPIFWETPSIMVSVYPLEGEPTRLHEGPSAIEHWATGDATWRDASEIVDVIVPLPATARDEVVVEIGDNWGCTGMIPWLPNANLLVDDIRAE